MAVKQLLGISPYAAPPFATGSKAATFASIDPETGQLAPILNPREDRWEDHCLVQNGEVLGLTAKGRVTVRLLRMNRPARVRERQAQEY
jgi:hypothetical protein